MSHIYGATKEANNLTPVSLTPGEQETGMTTAESATHMDTSSPDYTGTEKKKPSLLKKVKAKANKLKNKLKPGYHEGETPTHENDNSSASAFSSDEEEETPEFGYTPLSKAVNMDDDKTTTHAPAAPGDSAYNGKQSDDSGVNLGAGYAVPQEDRKFGLLDIPDHKGRQAAEDLSAPASVPLSQLKSPGPAGVEQAVPTTYHYYNKDPADAYVTPSSSAPGIDSGDTEVLTEDTLSALGGESAGVTPILSDSRAFGSEKSGAGDKSFSSGEFSLHDNSNRSADGSYEEDRSAKIHEGMLARGAAETHSWQGRDDDSFGGKAYNQDVGIATPSTNVSGTLDGAKDAAVDKIGYGSTDDQTIPSDSPSTGDYSTEPQKPLHQRAYEGLTGAAVGMSQTLGVYRPPSETSSSEHTMTQKAYDTVVGTKDAAADQLSGGDGSYSQPGQPTVAQKAYDTVVGTTETLTETGDGVKESAASKLGYEGSSTHTPGEQMVQSAKNRAIDAKNVTADKLGQADVALSSDSTPVSKKATDTASGAKDSTISTLSPTEGDKALSQSVTDTISNLPTLLTEKLGFGGNSASTTNKSLQSPSELEIPVSHSPSNVNTTADTPDSAAASPGIVNRVTDAVSSFWGGKKKPTAGGEEYSPTVSPSESGRREIADSSSIVSDVGVKSSPAA